MWEHNSEWYFNHAQMSFLYSSSDPFEIQFEICCFFFRVNDFKKDFNILLTNAMCFTLARIETILWTLRIVCNVLEIWQILTNSCWIKWIRKLVQLILYHTLSWASRLICTKGKAFEHLSICDKSKIRTFSLHSICFSSKSQINW